MAQEDLERYETDVELKIYKEYRDVVAMFRYVVETERRFYLANNVDVQTRHVEGAVYFDMELDDAWVWDMYRPARFVKRVKVMTFSDVNIEEIQHPDDPLRYVGWRLSGISRALRCAAFQVCWARCVRVLRGSARRPLRIVNRWRVSVR